MVYPRNELLDNPLLPVDIVLAPAWWYRHEGITFDEDFFYHLARRVEVERRMEQVLYDRWGAYGLGSDHLEDRPQLGAVHLAAGYLVAEMLGCEVDYLADTPPQVKPANLDRLEIAEDAAFQSPAFKRLERLMEALRTRHGYVTGDVNFNGILNTALDLRGQAYLTDLLDCPDEARQFAAQIAQVLERFTAFVGRATGSTSISVNRNVRHIARPVFLHSECSHVMISVRSYEQFLMPHDVAWSRQHRPFGIHYCGADPHRYADAFARLPHLDFLDVGWGGDVARLRQRLPNTFLNLRYSPVELVKQEPQQIRATVRRLVGQSGNPWLTGVCVINVDDTVSDAQITALLDEVTQLRSEFQAA
jgi:hypothetical protein